MRILHILDASAPEDTLDMLALLTNRPALSSSPITHHILALGPANLSRAATRAGISKEIIHPARSLGWADPAAWRAIRHALRTFAPTHLHAWSISAALAAALHPISCFPGPRLLTLADTPTRRPLRLLRILTARSPWAITANSSSILRTLLHAGLPPDRLLRIRPGIPLAAATGAPKLLLRQSLGLQPTDGPIILLGGPPTRAARYHHALWAAAILQEIYPHTKVLYRPAESKKQETVSQIQKTRTEKQETRNSQPSSGNWKPQTENSPEASPSPTTEFLRGLHHPPLAVAAPPNLPFSTLVQAADLLLVAADAPIPTGTLLWAMAASVPVIATAIEPISELIEHSHTGLLAAPGKPRALTKRLTEFMADSTLRWPLTDHARSALYSHFKPSTMLESFDALYQQTAEDPALAKALAIPT